MPDDVITIRLIKQNFIKIVLNVNHFNNMYSLADLLHTALKPCNHKGV